MPRKRRRERHGWQGTTVVLLTTTGATRVPRGPRRWSTKRHGDAYLVVASNGGGNPPGWFLNLQDDSIVAVR
ncbi:MAG: nitroreductase family deazaflavin-dependent oxidoreductase, partial [Actinobacteria bacterium]|nr:nitroreductase family deazaflavin-dependent oxidoreductase [Actinomycetota bacterium]